MSELTDLYQEVILDHNKKPRNFQKLADANRSAEGFNPLCGDQIQLYVKVEDGVIRDIGFQGSGCAISKASASLMTSTLKGKSEKEADELFDVLRGRPFVDRLMYSVTEVAEGCPVLIGQLALEGIDLVVDTKNQLISTLNSANRYAMLFRR